MNIAKQRRKITHLLDNAPNSDHRRYLEHVLHEFDSSIKNGYPIPSKEFLGAYFEEFDIS